MKNETIHLIVDPSWKGNLALLSKTNQIWIINTSENSDMINEARSKVESVNYQWQGITTFNSKNGETALRDMIITIDEHHSGRKTEGVGPWNEIRVLGMPWVSKLRPIIAEQIPTILWSVEQTDGGFIIRRVP